MAGRLDQTTLWRVHLSFLYKSNTASSNTNMRLFWAMFSLLFEKRPVTVDKTITLDWHATPLCHYRKEVWSTMLIEQRATSLLLYYYVHVINNSKSSWPIFNNPFSCNLQLNEDIFLVIYVSFKVIILMNTFALLFWILIHIHFKDLIWNLANGTL